jgi:hypothetical protein
MYSNLKINYVSDSAYGSFSVVADPVAVNYGMASYITTYNISVFEKYMFAGTANYNYPTAIFDLEAGAQVGSVFCPYQDRDFRVGRHLMDSSDLGIYFRSFDTSQYSYPAVQNNAVAIYRLPIDAPERPEGYGMTITYELEVQY